MILAALILQVAAPQTAVDAERAFNAAAQAKGQWTAFREYAAADAIMFVPQPVNAQEWLKDRKDPAKSVEWWPTESYVSCSGDMAVNHGGWKRPDGSVGYFSTVWERQADGSWKWGMDHGDIAVTALAKPASPKVVRASCDGKPTRVGVEPMPGRKIYLGQSRDNSLAFIAFVDTDGHRRFSAAVWTGTAHDVLVRDEVDAPAK